MSMSISCAATQLRIQLLLRAPLNARAIDQRARSCFWSRAAAPAHLPARARASC
jgi:hypothetical protein